MSIFKFALCCPDCGGEEWHDMPNLKYDEYCCCNCGTVCSIDEMETAIIGGFSFCLEIEHFKTRL